ncbi:hypothetical protein P3342_006004 [Pyrenophora teres f. teres]|nr:hypothetical protein P3342_006004 [Pyrenophora teres f. teres]
MRNINMYLFWSTGPVFVSRLPKVVTIQRYLQLFKGQLQTLRQAVVCDNTHLCESTCIRLVAMLMKYDHHHHQTMFTSPVHTLSAHHTTCKVWGCNYSLTNQVAFPPRALIDDRKVPSF